MKRTCVMYQADSVSPVSRKVVRLRVEQQETDSIFAKQKYSILHVVLVLAIQKVLDAKWFKCVVFRDWGQSSTRKTRFQFGFYRCSLKTIALLIPT